MVKSYRRFSRSVNIHRTNLRDVAPAAVVRRVESLPPVGDLRRAQHVPPIGEAGSAQGRDKDCFKVT